jgi:hypothetical protein
MWTEDKLKEAAWEWTIKLEEETYCYVDVVDAFLAGANYIINNTQKQ